MRIVRPTIIESSLLTAGGEVIEAFRSVDTKIGRGHLAVSYASVAVTISSVYH